MRIEIVEQAHANGIAGFVVVVNGAPTEWVRTEAEAFEVIAILHGVN